MELGRNPGLFELGFFGFDVTKATGRKNPGDGQAMAATGVTMLVLTAGQQLPLDPQALLSEHGIRTIVASDLDQARGLWRRLRPGILLLPGVFEAKPTTPFLQACLADAPNLQAIVIVDRAQINEAADAMRVGALDCLFRPFTQERLTKTLAAARRRLDHSTSMTMPDKKSWPKTPRASSANTPARPENRPEFQRMLSVTGSHPASIELRRQIRAVAASSLPVLIRGEVGSGKLRCAKIIHSLWAGTSTSFHIIDCAALSNETLPEDVLSKLSGAGKVSLYFDEICDLSLEVQARLVRLIGDEQPTRIRLISATRLDPEAQIDRQLLRRDLYHRLCVAQITVPPLRDRGGDLVEIAREKMAGFALEEAGGFAGFSADTLSRLLAYSWPGNVLELTNVIRNIVVLHGEPGADGQIEQHMLPMEIGPGPALAGAFPSPPDTNMLARLVQGKSLAAIERLIIEAVLEAHAGSVTGAASALKVAPSTLYRKRLAWSDQAPPDDTPQA